MRRLYADAAPGLAREARRAGKYAVAIGVHNALSAVLAQRSGFDGVWLSSLEVSSSKALPDANLVNLTEMAQLIREIRATVEVPIMVDGDNGYGSDELAVRAALEYLRAGADTLCLEDNAFPKRCSFYREAKRSLEPKEDFSQRLHAVKQATEGRLELIARTEGLVAGLGPDQTIERAMSYVSAGADAIFVQTTSSDLASYWAVIREVSHLAPIVFTPTALPDVTASQLHDMGVDVVIFANVGVRAIVQAMQSTLSTLRRRESLASVSESIASLEALFGVAAAYPMPAAPAESPVPQGAS